MKSAPFTPGDHVRVLDSHYIHEVAGKLGVIAVAPEVMRTHDSRWHGHWRSESSGDAASRVYWVEFEADCSVDPRGATTGAEIGEDELRSAT